MNARSSAADGREVGVEASAVVAAIGTVDDVAGVGVVDAAVHFKHKARHAPISGTRHTVSIAVSKTQPDSGVHTFLIWSSFFVQKLGSTRAHCGSVTWAVVTVAVL